MHKLAAAVVTSLLVLATTGTALAGARYSRPVQVNPTNRYASGSLGSTRNSGDTTSYLICETYLGAGQALGANCIARDASGRFGSCNTTDPGMVQAIMSIQGDSFVWFNWDVNSRCAYVSVQNGSSEEPKR